MRINQDVPLKNYTTMKVGGKSSIMITINRTDELEKAVNMVLEKNLPLFVMGGGSNTIVKDEDFKGVVLLNRIRGFKVLSEDPGQVIIKLGGGENWDDVVAKTVEMGLSGIEALSNIPGSVGAAPVQNIGAYGQELSSSLVELEAYDIHDRKFVTLDNAACGFAYRTSIFKTTARGRYIITSTTLSLTHTAMQPPFYASLQKYLDENNIQYYTPKVIRDAVIAIRRNRLPNPELYPNAGSFFKNPVIEKWLLEEIQKSHDDIPTFDMGQNSYKIPAGWLIEQVEKKGYAAHNFKTYEKNALVVINQGNGNYADLNAFRNEIISAVRDEFRITLEQEPIEI